MKLLVTGGAGFIGSHVAEYYAKRGNEVIVFDNVSRLEILGKKAGNSLYNWNYLKNNYPKIEFVKDDIRSFERVKASTKDVDVIIHTAAQVAVTTSLSEPKIDFEINTVGTFNVLETARLNDAAFVFCSTNKVYGENVNKIPLKEDGGHYYFADEKYRNGIPESFSVDLCRHSPYGCSKLAADIYVQDYAHTYGLKTGVFRMSCVYGERQLGFEEQGWVAWFVIAAIIGHAITIYGDGKQVRDVLYVGDLIQAFDKFLNLSLRHEVFNIGGGPVNTLSLLELLTMLEEQAKMNVCVKFAEWRSADQRVYVSDISKAKRLLSWEPKVNPKEGVRKLVEWASKSVNLLRERH